MRQFISGNLNYSSWSIRPLLVARKVALPVEEIIVPLDFPESTAKLKEINEKLWVNEDDIRDCERQKDFSSRFIELARAVYFSNDVRATLKRQINDLLKSPLVEEKSYAKYD